MVWYGMVVSWYGTNTYHTSMVVPPLVPYLCIIPRHAAYDDDLLVHSEKNPQQTTNLGAEN